MTKRKRLLPLSFWVNTYNELEELQLELLRKMIAIHKLEHLEKELLTLKLTFRKSILHLRKRKRIVAH